MIEMNEIKMKMNRLKWSLFKGTMIEIDVSKVHRLKWTKIESIMIKIDILIVYGYKWTRVKNKWTKISFNFFKVMIDATVCFLINDRVNLIFVIKSL